jgi:hypothetical protein
MYLLYNSIMKLSGQKAAAADSTSIFAASRLPLAD